MHLFTGKYIVVSDLVDGQCLISLLDHKYNKRHIK